MMKEEHYWYWINNVYGIGRTTVGRLLEEYGNLKEVYNESDIMISHFLKMNNCRLSMDEYSYSKNENNIIYSYERLARKGIRFIYYGCSDYPEKLYNIPDPPYGLYYKGSLPDENKPAIAIIGARNSTHYGREMARLFGRELAKAGVTVISGLARGIDGMAHRGAVEAGRYTLGVLGSGIDVVYPEENYDLFMEMEKTGGIISESNIGIKPAAGLFPQRNRIISGMSDGILVIEAKEKSGTFITVDQGLEQGKEIFALPGRVMDATSKGCNNLIKLGAHFVTDVSDILEVLYGTIMEAKEKESKHQIWNPEYVKNLLAPTEKMVYSVLSVEPKYIDDIIRETRLSPVEACMYINKLSVDGYIDEPVRNFYSVKI